MDDSTITCDEVIKSSSVKETKTIPKNCNEKKVTCKKKKFLYFT